MVHSKDVYFVKDASNGFFGISNFASMDFIEGMYVVALAPAIMIISGSTFHPIMVLLFISGWYFSIFVITISRENLSLQCIEANNIL